MANRNLTDALNGEDLTTVQTIATGVAYSKTLLDAGQLDNRYYTETELNAGQLDTRYYTETEIDTNIYTKTEQDVTDDAQDVLIANTINQTNVDQTKLGSLTMGESISITSWSFVTTTITLTVASHNAKVGDTIYVSGLVSTTNPANGTYVITSVTATTIVYTALTPTGTPTVSSALVKYGDSYTKGNVKVATNESATLWSGSAGVSTITVEDMSEYEVIYFELSWVNGAIENIPYDLFKSGVQYAFVSSTAATDYLAVIQYSSDTSISITQAIGVTLIKVYGKGK